MKTAAVKTTAAAVKAASATAADCRARETASSRWASGEPATARETAAINSGTTIVTAAVVTEAAPVEAVEPGAGANEDAIHEPVGSIVAVGSAAVRIIAIVPVRADWRWCINRPDADSDSHAHLRLRGSPAEQSENSEQDSVFKVSHCFSL